MKTIAVIDDDAHIGDMLEEILTGEGYRVLRASSGPEALALVSRDRPDLILLDLMLPGLSGEEVLSSIQGIPVIVLSARTDVEDKVALLLGGAADGYETDPLSTGMTKPFDTRELLARIAVQLRRAEGTGILEAGDLVLDLPAMILRVLGRPVRLTRTEFAILKLLMENPGRVLARSALLDRIGRDTPDCTERSLKQHVSNLRGKIQEAGGRDPIETVWGIGFRLADQKS